ncbi:MAG: serine/threonine-protein kinase [Gemmatimonadaceae bacterium]
MTSDLRARLQGALGSNYSLQRELGGAGMSHVFVARDETLGRNVVIKILMPNLAATLNVERFTREIRLVASLQQANIVPVIASGAVGALPYYSMPFIEGPTLRERIQRRSLPLSESVRILGDIARALEYAHEHGIIHRDIKPENVLLSGRTAVVTDFGIAKAINAAAKTPELARSLTGAGTSLGTPGYMAPEQAAGDEVDARADLYAWGVVAYEVLTGSHPFPGKTSALQLIAAQITEKPRPIDELRDLPEPLAVLVMRAIEKNPAARPQSAAEVIKALDDSAPLLKKRRRWKVVALVMTLALIAALIALRLTR